MATEKLDAIIFGATGYTGKIVVEDAIEILKDFKWGIAGRNESKLLTIRESIGNRIGQDLSHIPIIIADVSDSKSLDEMAKRCKIILNCVGPYRVYGEAVVKACIDAGTHYVDVTGEPQFVDSMQLKYHELAQANGAYVIPTCGFESICAEMAVLYTEKNYPGLLNSVESYWETKLNYENKSSKAILHSGTWDSVIYYLQHFKEIALLQRKLNCEKVPIFKPELKPQSGIQKTEDLKSYFLNIPTTARYMVQRSQRLLYLNEEKRPIQFTTYVGFRSYLWAIFVPLVMMIGLVMARFNFTRKLLLKYPQIFSFGYMTPEGPLEVNRKGVEFRYTLKAKGWYNSTPQTPDPSVELITRISGNDPYYGITSKSLLASAKTILLEHEKMPGSGGVFPPGYAFAKTGLLDELSNGNYGLKFEILEKKWDNINTN
ncbi:saccharopine dehydrogenase-like oxidoreductase [Haematobia irritans]|uniref:saccharopine dehydrogenase-like oxidoreductase n=1 Tax=Haematobia irritans TaxID=7368 RepID=UPI003F50147B